MNKTRRQKAAGLGGLMQMLIVDDSRTMRNFLSAIARNLSFVTEEACDGEDALQRLSEGKAFDVALFDWDMPKMNGISLLGEVRARPEFDQMKIMMVTSQSGMDSLCEAVSKGADDYLMKPVTPDMLAEKLRLLGLLD